MTTAKIIYTKTDEAPALATRSLLPIIRVFAKAAGIKIISSDISLAGRILAKFPDYLNPDQQVNDALAELGELVLKSEANIIKLPNISASVPQLKMAIKELQQRGYKLPDYPEDPKTDEQRKVRTQYDKIKGSAVNPVLREGNSDRRAPLAVKNYVRKNPHSMGAWSADSKTHVASMKDADFFATEQSCCVTSAVNVRIELTDDEGNTQILKSSIAVLEGEIIDASTLSKNELRKFIAAQITRAKEDNVLFSLHL